MRLSEGGALMTVKNILFRTSRREMVIGERTLVMGIINTTPDSFSDGGLFAVPDRAVEEGIRMVGEGVDILDIGGESTRPGSDFVSLDEELRRVVPVVRGLAARVSVPLSVDTMKAEVARAVLEEGAEIINDVSSFNHDADMAKTVARYRAGVILMHMRGVPKVMQQGDLTYSSLIGDILDFLRDRMEAGRTAGIDELAVVVDPGIGFGKTGDDNMRIIKYINDFNCLNRPILVGVSRKSFIGRITGGEPAERVEGTAAAVTAAILNGAHIVRVHDVAVMKKVVAMADAINRV
jgi:dihydropteroate synthase